MADNLKITDFGLSTVFRHQGQERKLSKCCGTPPYVAPEVHTVHAGKFSSSNASVTSCVVIIAKHIIPLLGYFMAFRVHYC